MPTYYTVIYVLFYRVATENSGFVTGV